MSAVSGPARERLIEAVAVLDEVQAELHTQWGRVCGGAAAEVDLLELMGRLHRAERLVSGALSGSCEAQRNRQAEAAELSTSSMMPSDTARRTASA